MTDPVEQNDSALSPEARKSKTAFIVSVIGAVICIAAPVGLLLSLSALRTQKQKAVSLRYRRFARAALIISVFSIVLWTGLIAAGVRELRKVVCNINLYYGVMPAIQLYRDDYNTLPTADQWCDLLIEHADLSAQTFRCPASDTIEGESTYAINIHLYDVPFDNIPPDMVVLFETDAGKESGPRTANACDRGFYRFFADQQTGGFNRLSAVRVYPKRWNQVGGPDIAAAIHGKRCHVLLMDGTHKAVELSAIRSLRWTADSDTKPEP